MLFKRFLTVSPVAFEAVKPKRPPTAFSYYFSQVHKNIVETHNVRIPAAMKIAGEQWQTLSESEKQKYSDALKPLQQKYTAEYEAYAKTLPPKKPATTFGSFLKEKSPLLKSEHPDLDQTEIMKLASSKWKSLDPSIKEQYQTRYSQQLAQYKKALEERAA
ncbi:unnamed protein product [Kluyveromyces dobzhanskii CBS 2104]|uniref:WGS project CCBQ000000000 data, contig 00272 n=1 Tax=Kluyveromyces dobzhanskii CBS 2104 TaxID=1427455 RepID=A0A0A8LAN7_9SACH|nr:unnamed protein product [Kluyveromyces dobzhanskii CBS 2104]